MYDKTLANLAALNDKDDGQFVPLENVPTLGQNPNLDNAILDMAYREVYLGFPSAIPAT